MFLGPLLHDRDSVRAAVRRRLRPRHPHRRAAHVRAAAVRPRGQGHRGQLPRQRRHGRSSPGRPIVLTERGDTVTENALLAAARHPGTTVIRNASPNYMVQDLCFFLTKLGVAIEGIGTTTLTVHGVERDRRRRRLRPVGGPDRGDEPARRRIVTESRDHHPAGADRVPRDRARAARGDGLPVRPHRGVPRRQRPHPARRPDHARRRRCTRRSTRSTRCRSRASTSTTCRSSR